MPGPGIRPGQMLTQWKRLPIFFGMDKQLPPLTRSVRRFAVVLVVVATSFMAAADTGEAQQRLERIKDAARIDFNNASRPPTYSSPAPHLSPKGLGTVQVPPIKPPRIVIDEGAPYKPVSRNTGLPVHQQFNSVANRF